MSADRTIPRATYRLQLHGEFGFDAVAGLAAYLARLGVSHVYLSPCLQAAPGSTHGYDVVDHSRVSEALGGSDGFDRMCHALREHGLGLVIDVVPNHMSIANPKLNPWWWDVLRNGASSLFAQYFDVDWRHPDDRVRNRVLVPILGDHYGRVLQAGQISIQRLGAEFAIRVGEQDLPVAPISLSGPLQRAADRCKSEDLAFVAETLAALPSPTATDQESRSRRHRHIAAIDGFLARLLSNQTEVARAIDNELARMNHETSELHEFLERQNFRLAYWKAARQDLDYRRFFDITELAALRIEDEKVFQQTHGLVLKWAQEGTVDGLRIDHPDGLRDPEEYLQRLRTAAPRAWIVAEKILEPREELPRSWPIEGTTGYDFLGMLNGLFVDRAAEEALTSFCVKFVNEEGQAFEDLVGDKKRLALRELLASDLTRLVEAFVQVCEARLEHRDYTRPELRACLEEVLVCLPVYRTYVRGGQQATDRDHAIIRTAVAQAKVARSELDARLFDFFSTLLTHPQVGDAAADLVCRFQQLSGPAMAKGVEDTAFYCYPRLISLNEVGGNPGVFGTTPDEFHRHCARIQAAWPATMTTTSTHDTKRSEDVRIRIALISEVPEQWCSAVSRWAAHNERHRLGQWPDRSMEYVLYQTLVGAWPLGKQRLAEYVHKAAREAKKHTSWTRPDHAYEDALSTFCTRVVEDSWFVDELEAFLRPLRKAAHTHSLAQILLKLCAPGVPDIYQGNELWDYSLTDPDNRRPIDFHLRRELLQNAMGLSAQHVFANPDNGLSKLWLTHRALALRKTRPSAFGAGAEYVPLRAVGPQAHRIIAFMRGRQVVVIAPRLVFGAQGEWAGTFVSMPEGAWRNVLDEEQTLAGKVDITAAFSAFPVALLRREK